MARNTSNTTIGETSDDGGNGTSDAAWTLTAQQCYILLQKNHTDLNVEDCHAATANTEGSGALAIVFGLAIILANLPIILGIVKKRSLHKPMYYLIANMAGTDTIFGVMCFVLPTVRQAGGGEGTYLKLYTTFFFSIFLSLMGLMLLTLDRYISIYHGLFHMTSINSKHVSLAVFFTWVVSGLVCFSPLLGWTCSAKTKSSDTCFNDLDLHYFIFLVVMMIVAVSIVVGMNIRIYLTLRRRLLAVGVEINASVHMNVQQLTRAKKKATTVALLACTCIVSWTPYIVAMIQLLDSFYMRSVEDRLSYNPGAWGVAVLFLGVFPVLNPVLYAYRLPQLRTAIKKLCPGRRVCCRQCLGTRNQVTPIVNIEANTSVTLPIVDVR